jgi:septum site-determining protein MinD
MGQVVSIQSYRGGTGKSNLAANLAVALADRGRRVAVLDTDLSSPGVHVLFNFDKNRLTHGLGDFLQGRCDLEDVAYDVSSAAGLTAGALHLVPSHLKTEAILRLVSEGYEVAQLHRQIRAFMEQLKLDHLVMDTHPGLNRETLLTTAISDALLILVRPDRQDFHGTAVIAEIATRMKTRRAWLVGNKVLARTDGDAFAAKLKEHFDREVLAVLPLAEELMLLGSEGLFLRTQPHHAYSATVRAMAARLVETAGAAPGGP